MEFCYLLYRKKKKNFWFSFKNGYRIKVRTKNNKNNNNSILWYIVVIKNLLFLFLFKYFLSKIFQLYHIVHSFCKFYKSCIFVKIHWNYVLAVPVWTYSAKMSKIPVTFEFRWTPAWCAAITGRQYL